MPGTTSTGLWFSASCRQLALPFGFSINTFTVFTLRFLFLSFFWTSISQTLSGCLNCWSPMVTSLWTPRQRLPCGHWGHSGRREELWLGRWEAASEEGASADPLSGWTCVEHVGHQGVQAEIWITTVFKSWWKYGAYWEMLVWLAWEYETWRPWLRSLF